MHPFGEALDQILIPGQIPSSSPDPGPCSHPGMKNSTSLAHTSPNPPGAGLEASGPTSLPVAFSGSQPSAGGLLAWDTLPEERTMRWGAFYSPKPHPWSTSQPSVLCSLPCCSGQSLLPDVSEYGKCLLIPNSVCAFRKRFQEEKMRGSDGSFYGSTWQGHSVQVFGQTLFWMFLRRCFLDEIDI